MQLISKKWHCFSQSADPCWRGRLMPIMSAVWAEHLRAPQSKSRGFYFSCWGDNWLWLAHESVSKRQSTHRHTGEHGLSCGLWIKFRHGAMVKNIGRSWGGCWKEGQMVPGSQVASLPHWNSAMCRHWWQDAVLDQHTTWPRFSVACRSPTANPWLWRPPFLDRFLFEIKGSCVAQD